MSERKLLGIHHMGQSHGSRAHATPWLRHIASLTLFPILSVSSCDATAVDPPTDGFLLITLVTPSLEGTPLANLEELEADANRIDVVHRTDCNDAETETVFTVLSTPPNLRLTTASPNLPRAIAPQIPIAPGCVMQIRFIVDEMRASIGGEVTAVKVPSGAQTGIKVIPSKGTGPFPITSGATTAIRIDYDPADKLVINKGQGVIEKPVLPAVLVPAELALGVILDQVVLTFEPGTSDDAIARVVESGGGTILEHYPHGFVTVKLATTNELPEKIQLYSEARGVAAAIPNTLVDTLGPNPFPMGIPNDPLYTDVPPSGFESLNLDAVHALDAWRVTTGSSVVVAGIVDNGFDLLHGDLLDNIWINEGEIPKAIKDKIMDVGEPGITFADLNDPVNDGICPKTNSPPFDICDPLDLVNGVCPGGVCQAGYGFQDGNDTDGNGFIDDLVGWDFGSKDNLPEPPAESIAPLHGTAVAGQLGARGNNTIAATGIAWHVRLMLAKANLISNPEGEAGKLKPIPDRLTRDSMLRALVYVHNNGAKVVNLSLGSSITREDAEIGGCESRGVHYVPTLKFAPGLAALEAEWSTLLGPLQDKAVLSLAMNDCGEDNDRDGNFFYPAFTTPRPDLGLSFVHATMITVASATTWDDFNSQPITFPGVSSFSSFGEKTVLIAAPGDNLRVLNAQTYPPTGINNAVTDCGNGPVKRCQGTSFAAPVVAGAAALVAANNVGLNAVDIKKRILDNATIDVALQNQVENQRLLRIDSAVGP